MERESFKEYSEAAIVEERRALCDEILLRAGTLYVFINARRYFFGSQSRTSGVLKNFQTAEGFYGKKMTFFDGNLC